MSMQHNYKMKIVTLVNISVFLAFQGQISAGKITNPGES